MPEIRICTASGNADHPSATLTVRTLTMKSLVLPFLALGLATAHADEAAKAKLMEIGKTAYATCAACHGADGAGLPVGTQKMAPPIGGSKLVTGKPDVLALLILKGIAKENQNYLGIMAPLEAAFPDDEKLAGILTYVRNSFGNSASVVTAEDAKKFRAQWAEIKTPVTRAKIDELEK